MGVQKSLLPVSLCAWGEVRAQISYARAAKHLLANLANIPM
jgi:hypothetical protein